jgi:hypothetical protein
MVKGIGSDGYAHLIEAEESRRMLITFSFTSFHHF